MPLALRARRLDANHDMTFGRGRANFATGTEATAQRLRTAMLLVLGEWFDDVTAGVPWFPAGDSEVRAIMGKSADLSYAEAVLKARILGINGVQSLDSFEIELDHATRKMSATATVTDVDGNTFDVAFQDPGP
jgi:hypothetical protein